MLLTIIDENFIRMDGKVTIDKDDLLLANDKICILSLVKLPFILALPVSKSLCP